MAAAKTEDGALKAARAIRKWRAQMQATKSGTCGEARIRLWNAASGIRLWIAKR
jgi:hypothetical protein